MAKTKNLSRYWGDTKPLRIQIVNFDDSPYDLTNVTVIRLGVDELISPEPFSPVAVLDGVVDDPLEGWVIFNPDQIFSEMAASDYWGQIRFIESGKVSSTNKFKIVQDAPLFDMNT